MDKILNYQASLFGNFSNIRLTQDNLSKLKPIFPDYIINAFPITAIDVRTNRLITDDRIQLISSDKQYYITFLPERIDFTYNLTVENTPIIDLTHLKNQISEIVSKLGNIFKDVKANRLANSCNFSSKKYSREDIIKEINKYSKPGIFYSDISNLCEWQIRLNTRNIASLNGKEEESNNIVTLSLSVESESNYRIIGTIDINTNPRNTELRFCISDLSTYLACATKKMGEIITKIEDE